MAVRWLLLTIVMSGALAACGQLTDLTGTMGPTPAGSDESGELPEFVPRGQLTESDSRTEAPSTSFGEVLLIVDDEPEDPTELALAIAEEFGGRVLAGNPRLRIYQLSFADEELGELRKLADKMADLPDVKAAGPHYVGRFDPDW